MSVSGGFAVYYTALWGQPLTLYAQAFLALPLCVWMLDLSARGPPAVIRRSGA